MRIYLSTFPCSYTAIRETGGWLVFDENGRWRAFVLDMVVENGTIRKAESHGKHFNSAIKSKYKGTKVE